MNEIEAFVGEEASLLAQLLPSDDLLQQRPTELHCIAKDTLGPNFHCPSLFQNIN